MGLLGNFISIIADKDYQEDTFQVRINQWVEIPFDSPIAPGLYFNHETHRRPISINRPGSVLVYRKDGNNWKALYDFTLESALSSQDPHWQVRNNRLRLAISSFPSQPNLRDIETFKVVCIKLEARKKHPNIDVSNYNEVYNTFR